MFAQYKIYLIIIALAGFLVSAFVLGYRYSSYKCEAAKLEVLNDALADKENAERLLQEQAKKFEELRSKSQSKQLDLQKGLQNEIKKDNSYQYIVPSNGLRVLSQAIENANAS